MIRRRVAILGGGMAGLCAAWQLSRPGTAGTQITVYERGHVLGGKGASTRGPHGRIEEHGLHVWLGYYDHAFAVLRSCYDELDRARTDPRCPISTAHDAFVPASHIGFPDGWMAEFPEDGRMPGDVAASTATRSAVDLVTRALGLLVRLGVSLGSDQGAAPGPRALLSASPRPPRGSGAGVDLRRALSALSRAPVSRLGSVVDLFATIARGVATDQLSGAGSGSADDIDFRDWLRRYGATPATLDSPIVRGMYDFVFGFADGDRQRPAFAAGLGLTLANRMFFEYKGAIFWKMRAGMGDVVIAPLYETLRRRGVRFKLFHRVDGLHLSARDDVVEAVSITEQATLAAGIDDYEPLTRVRGLPVFPTRPDNAQLVAGAAPRLRRLQRGVDFDDVVVAMSIGALPATCSELIARNDAWRAMVDHIATVPTHAWQLWLRPDERALGWDGPAATVTGLGAPFDSYASMSHTIGFEAWPDAAPPRTSIAFCGVHNGERIADAAASFLSDRAPGLWPRLRANDPVSQYTRVNGDASDQYVQSLPGTDQYRLRAGDSGFANVFLAGDWTDCGLNAGCVEAAVMSGLAAGRALEASTS